MQSAVILLMETYDSIWYMIYDDCRLVDRVCPSYGDSYDGNSQAMATSGEDKLLGLSALSFGMFPTRRVVGARS